MQVVIFACKVVAPWLGIIAQNRELQDGPRKLGYRETGIMIFVFISYIINLVLIFKWSMMKISATTFLFPLWFLHVTHPKIMKGMTLLNEFRLDRFLDESVLLETGHNYLHAANVTDLNSEWGGVRAVALGSENLGIIDARIFQIQVNFFPFPWFITQA